MHFVLSRNYPLGYVSIHVYMYVRMYMDNTNDMREDIRLVTLPLSVIKYQLLHTQSSVSNY